MRITEQEIREVSTLIPIERYKYTIKRIADAEKLYYLQDSDGSWAVSEVRDKTLFPIWSAEEFARMCINGAWANFNVIEVVLELFQEELIYAIQDEGFLLNVFPVNDTTGFVVNIEEFVRDLTDELQNY
ncbi:DUF2750 domain-containing protein [Mucilaginibacter sp. PAMB04274]|uniref:DUF2750 domain-containing protein n=1 Tax=Mucilaginibacter sp. PAMB04274 TaxID=3138568 RepID=UPI0031F63A68